MSNIVPASRAPLMSGERPTAIVPSNIEQVWRLAELAAKSGLAPRDMATPEKCAVAILHGLEVGLPPMQALQRICVINGRPTIWGDAVLGLVRASRQLEFIKEEILGDGDAMVASCTVKRTGDPEPATRTFSVDDARAAGLWKKAGPWQSYPRRMLQMRARAFAVRDVFPDVTGGMYLSEEMDGAPMRDATPARTNVEAAAMIEPPSPSIVVADPPTEVPGSPAASAAADAQTIEGSAVVWEEGGERPAEAGEVEPPTPEAAPYPQPEGDGLDTPAFLKRNPDNSLPDSEPVTPTPSKSTKASKPDKVAKTPESPRVSEFDVAGWLRDLEGAASGCNTLDELIEVQNKIQIPAGKHLRTTNKGAWEQGKAVVLTASSRILGDASDDAEAA